MLTTDKVFKKCNTLQQHKAKGSGQHPNYSESNPLYEKASKSDPGKYQPIPILIPS